MSVSDVFDRYGNVVASILFSGVFNVCYRGWPYQFQPPTFLSQLTVLGVAANYSVVISSSTTSRQLIYVGDTVQLRLRGVAMSPRDSVVLMSGAACDSTGPSFQSQLSFVGTGILASRSNANSVIDVNLTSARFQVSGPHVLCYRSYFAGNDTSSSWALVKPIIFVNVFTVTSVSPVNMSYVFNDTIRLNLTGFGVINATRDQAQLNSDPQCGSTTGLNLALHHGNEWFSVKEVPVGTWYVCYAASPSTVLVVVRGYSVTVQSKFYSPLPGQEPFANGVGFGGAIALQLEGYGLPSFGDIAWLQRAGTPCSVNPVDNISLLANLTVTPQRLFSVASATLAGTFLPCYTAAYGKRVLGFERDVLTITPIPPTAFAPTLGGALIPVEIQLLGSRGVDLLKFGKVTNCISSDPLPVLTSTSVRFVPPAVGSYTLCYNPMLMQNGLPVQTIQINSTFFAVTNITSAAISPNVTSVQGFVRVQVLGAGVSSADALFLCSYGSNRTQEQASVVQITPQSFQVADAGEWELSFFLAGRYQLCFQSTSGSARSSVVFAVGSVTVDPTVGAIFPALVYSGIPTAITLSGNGIDSVRFAYINTVDASPACPSSTRGISNHASLLPVRNGSFTVTGGLRGEFLVCFVGISDVVYSTANFIMVIPFMSGMSTAPGTQARQGCASNISIAGSGIDSNLDDFFLSASAGCQDVAALVTGKFTTSRNATVFGVAYPPSIATYTLCYAQDGNVSDAFAVGSLVALPSLSVSPDLFGASIQYLCPAPAGTQFTFEVAVDGSSYWMPLLLKSSAPSMLIRYLPLRTPMVIRVNATRTLNSSTVIDAFSQGLIDVTLLNALNLPPCSSFPSNYSNLQANETKFAEAFFSLLKIVTTGCPNQNAQLFVTFDYASNLLNALPSLMSDPVLIPRTMASALSGVTISLQLAQTLLTAVSHLVKPYTPLSPDVVAAVSFMADSIFAELLRSNESYTMHRKVAATLLSSLFSLGTGFCAQSTSTTMSTNTFSLSVVQNSDAFLSGLLQIDQNTVVAVQLQSGQTSASGFCYVAVSNGENPLAVGDVPIISNARGFASQATSLFNLPLFSIAVNPFQNLSPRPSSISIQYVYPIYMQPSVPSSVGGTLYGYSSSQDAWIRQKSAVISRTTGTTAADRQVSLVVSNITDATLFISGNLVFTSTLTPPPLLQSRDYLLIIIASVLAGCYMLSALGGRMRDKRLDDLLRQHSHVTAPPTKSSSSAAEPFSSRETGLSSTTSAAESANVLGWRYAVAVARTPHHPISTFRRFALTLNIWAAMFVLSVLYFENARGATASAAAAAGALPIGIVAAVVAGLFGLWLRPLLFQQSRDYASIVAGFVGVFVASIGSFWSSFFVGALVGPPAALLCFLVVALVSRSTITVDGPARHVGLAGLFLSFVLMVAALGVSIFYTFSHSTTPQYIRDRLPLYSTLWGIALEVFGVEVILSRILSSIAPRLAQRFNDRRSVVYEKPQKRKESHSTATRIGRRQKIDPPTSARGKAQQHFEPFGFFETSDNDDDEPLDFESTDDSVGKKVIVVADGSATDDDGSSSAVSYQRLANWKTSEKPSLDELPDDDFFEFVDKPHDPFWSRGDAQTSPSSPGDGVLDEVNPLDANLFIDSKTPFEHSVRPLRLRPLSKRGGFNTARTSRTTSPAVRRAAAKSPYTINSVHDDDMTVIEFNNGDEIDDSQSDGQFLDVSRPPSTSSAGLLDDQFLDVSRPASPNGGGSQFVDVSRAPSAVSTAGSLFESVSLNGSQR